MSDYDDDASDYDEVSCYDDKVLTLFIATDLFIVTMMKFSD